MRPRKNILNNKILDNIRQDRIYQAIITDLALTGNIPGADAAMLLGYEIPEYLKAPDGKNIKDWAQFYEEDAAAESTEKSVDISKTKAVQE